MFNTTLKIKRVNKDAVLPSYAHDGDAGLDLSSMADITLQPGERKTVPTGVAIQLEYGYEAQIRPRSGMAKDYGISVLNSPGTIDLYTGEIKVILINLGQNTYHIEKGSRIAQMVINKLPKVNIVEVEELGETSRGDKGFGSSGK